MEIPVIPSTAASISKTTFRFLKVTRLLPFYDAFLSHNEKNQKHAGNIGLEHHFIAEKAAGSFHFR
jgi:hypothetical protein